MSERLSDGLETVVVWLAFVIFHRTMPTSPYQQELLSCPETFQSVSALLCKRKIQGCKQMYINQMLKKSLLFFLPLLLQLPSLSLIATEQRRIFRPSKRKRSDTSDI